MDETQHIRARLEQCMKRVPAGVNAGSYQTVMMFKQWAVSARTAINNKQSKAHTLTSLCNQYEGFK